MRKRPALPDGQTIWEEIMRSPLEPDPDESSRAVQILTVVLAAAIGLTVGYVVARPSEADELASDILAVTTTATAAPTQPDPIFPPGYAGTSRVGIKPIATYASGETLLMVVSSATRSDLDRVEVDEFHIAEWTLEGDGVAAVASRSITSDFAPGIRVVEFPAASAIPISAPELHVRQATEMVVRSGCHGCAATSVDMAEGEVVLEGATVPYRSTEPLLISVGSGLNLSIDELHAADEWGYAAWHLIEENDGKARVSLSIVFEGTDDPATNDIDSTALVPANRVGPSPQNPVAGSLGPFGRTGTQQLERVGEILSEDNQPERLVLRWSVEWQHPVGDPVALPVVDLFDLGSVE
jgi:hypothetical protein